MYDTVVAIQPGFLERSVLFAGLSEEACSHATRWFEPRGFSPGERLDSGPQGFGVILDGSFRDAAGRAPPRAAGDVAGTLGPVLVAEGRVRVAWLSLAKLDQISVQHPGLGYELLRRALSLATTTPSALGAPLAERLPHEIGGSAVVAARIGGVLVTLENAIGDAGDVTPVTTDSWEGKDIYRRSASMALLAAAARIRLPMRLGPTLTTGRIVHATASEAEQAALLRALQAVLAEDLPILVETFRLADAMRVLEPVSPEAAALLSLESSSVVTLLRAGDAHALSLGPVLPSTGRLSNLALSTHPEGLFLDFGPAVRRSLSREERTTRVLELAAPRFGGEMVLAGRGFLSRLGITTVADLSRSSVSGKVRELVRVAEGFHEKRIAGIADEITARQPGTRVVGIAGPSSSGKTTFISRLSVQLEVAGVRPVAISLDDYYVDRERTPRDERGDYDFEALEALDLSRLQDHVARLLAGETVKIARYDFQTGKSHPEGGPELRLEPGSVLLLEGIHALARSLLPALGAGEIYRVFIHPALALPFDRLTLLEPSEVRLLRRLVRDRHQRGHTASATLARWPSVRRGERLHIYPHLPRADTVFDSSLAYEMGVLRVYAERYLMEVDRCDPAYATATRLRRMLEHVVPIHPEHVPDGSILREFLGSRSSSL